MNSRSVSSPIEAEVRASRQGLILAVAALFSITPMLAFGPVPALLDYPNHLARMSILARAGTPDANPFFETAWSFMPNLAMDLIVPPLARIIGIERAGLLFLIMSHLLLIVGAVALDFAVKRRLAWGGYAAILLLYGQPFAWGFVNFQFGLGIALICLAGWIRLSRDGWFALLAWHAGACLTLFACHLFTLGIYGWAVGLFELWRWRQDKVALTGRAALTALLVVPPAALLGIMHLSGTSVGGERASWLLASKQFALIAANGFHLNVALAMTLVTAATLFCLRWRGALRIVGAGTYLAFGFLALFVVMPFRLLDTALVDVRVVVAAFLILPAFTAIRLRDPLERGLARGALAAMIAATVVTTAWSQWSYRPTYSALLASFDRLPKGSKVLLAYADGPPELPGGQWDFPLHHVGTLAVLRANAFVPSLFMYAGKQPIRPVSAIRHLAGPEGGPTPISVLRSYLDDPDRLYPGEEHLNHWARDFDFLCVLDPKSLPPENPMPGVLTPVARGDRFVLYRITKG